MSHLRTLVPSALLTMIVLAGGAAAAAEGECASDADCGAGWHCEKSWSAPGCEPGGECGGEPVESETGSCVRDPIACATDADCPEYLRCLESGDSACSAAPGEEPVCEAPDPSEKQCGWAPIDCSTDSDCPANFLCAAHELCSGGCPVDPSGGGTCSSGCEQVRACEPRELACATSADCPGDWECVVVEATDCTAPAPPPGGGATPGGAGASEPAEECTPTERRACLPPYLGGYGYGGAVESGGDSGGNLGTPRASSDGGDASDDGSCSMTSAPRSGSRAWALLAVAGLAALGRRRRP
ncbi:MAG: hypothetical protein IT376_16575 [Polyangiaceae bacterium]|nr:hypothetical protein [Polyangiaceae bacterium]